MKVEKTELETLHEVGERLMKVSLSGEVVVVQVP
jgi:hypothetical protein